jgi:peptide/nickel transport system substrate-binding protein
VRSAVILVLVAAVAVLIAAAPANGNGPKEATPAAAPFAEAWTQVPASAAARRAANVVVFGAPSSVDGGFNTILNCCSVLWNGYLAADEALRGAFNQDVRGGWYKDLVSTATATRTSLSYTIRPDAYWYWGGRKVPVTYKDFVYTLQQIDDPNNDLSGRNGYGNLDPTRFTHRGDKRVTFFWKTANCSTDFPCGPYANWQSIFSQLYPSFALAGLDFNKIWTTCICGNDGKPVADGPFYLANYTPGQGTTLKANPYYHAKPKVSEVDFKVIRDPFALLQAMLGGQIDASAPPFGNDSSALKHAPGITFDQVPGYGFEHLELREGDAKAGPTVSRGASNVLLRAPWLREALMLGIDRRRIIAAVFGDLAGGIQPLDDVLFYSTEKGYRPSFRRWDYNPRKALAILKKHCVAGSGPAVPDSANTKIWQCAGLPATFNWSWVAGRDDWTTTEQLAKNELRSIGIDIKDRPVPRNVAFSPDGYQSGDFDMVQFRIFTTGDPGDWYDQYRCGGNGNWTGYCSHAVDALLEAANAQLDPVKRIALYQRADAIMATEIPVIPMYQVPAALIHRSDLLGMIANPGLDGPFWNIEAWHWRR